MVFLTMGVAALSMVMYWLAWGPSRRVGLAVLFGLMPAVAVLVAVPAWWSS